MNSLLDALYELECSSFPDPWSRSSLEEEIRSASATIALIDASDRIMSLSGGNGEPSGAASGGNAQINPSHKGRLRAYLSLHSVPADQSAEIVRIAVHPDFRRQGLGRRLLQWAIQYMDHSMNEVWRIFLQVSSSNYAAHQLYESFGFQILSRRKAYYRDGSDALVLRLQKGRS